MGPRGSRRGDQAAALPGIRSGWGGAIIFLLLFNIISISEDLFYSFILVLTVLHLHCRLGFSPVVSGVVHELLRAVASLAVARGLQGMQVSGAAAREFSSRGSPAQ